MDHVEYAGVQNINFPSAKKMKAELDSKISNLQPEVSNCELSDPPNHGVVQGAPKFVPLI